MKSGSKMKKHFLFTILYSIFLYFGQAKKWCQNPLRFGPSCEYQCHCGAYYCDRNTGDCQSGVDCEAGWMGSGCQYVNIANGARQKSNHLYPASRIVDGSRQTCASKTSSSKSNVAYVTIDFERDVKIGEVHLLFSKSGSPPPFNVSIHSTNNNTMCASVNHTIDRKEFIVKCGISLYGQYLNITSNVPDAKLELCEVQVPAGRNLAYGKPAYQSSLFKTRHASQAVDGDTDGPSWQTCASTNQSTNPWWLLDIQSPINIQWFRIYNNYNVFISTMMFPVNERLVNFRILLSEDNMTFKEHYRDNSTNPQLIYKPVLKPGVHARFVKIDLQGKYRILTLCEVQVFGDCADGRYGDCNKTCDNCLEQTCDKLTGYCQECRRGFYGDRCDQACDYCQNGDCEKAIGVCSLCPPGKQGTLCQYNYSNHHYGYNCTEKCGKCLDGHTCDTVTGHCQHRCQNGWQGEKCQQTSIENKLIESSSIDDGLVGRSVGITIVVVVIVVSAVIIIIVKRRRKVAIPMSNILRQRTKDDGPVYENSTFYDMKNDTPSTHKSRNTDYENKCTTMPKHDDSAVRLTSEESEAYYSIERELPKGTIPLFRLWNYVQEKFQDEIYFSEEFNKLPSGPQLSTTAALRPENINKNRYKQLYAYDFNRVVLKPFDDDDNDYINASFVDGYSRPKMYIASQGTTKYNINDFWRMLWQYDVETIVMLTGLVEAGKRKCELYWPEEEGETRMFGRVVVILLDTDSFADYEIRTLKMTVDDQSKLLTQLHYTAWPDNGVPKVASSIVQFWNRVNRVHTVNPIVVHCSAGVGRTGTYIALDYLVHQAQAAGYVNVSACISNLRRQRVNLVQTKEQYIFLHKILVEALMFGTVTSSTDFPNMLQELLEVDSKSGKLKLQLEYEKLQNEVVTHEAPNAIIKIEDENDSMVGSTKHDFSAAKQPGNRFQKRPDNILPADRHRVFLSTPVFDRDDYINAVVLPSHRQREGFILTQMPLADSVIDFWRLIYDYEVRTIIMFSSKSSKSRDIGIYRPSDGEMLAGPFTIRLTKQEKQKHYIESALSFSFRGDENGTSVRQFQFTNWAETADVPGSTESLLQLLDDVESRQKSADAKPVVVHCLNGALRSGLYCVISTVIERLKVEGDVAIAQTIKGMKTIHQEVIPNYEQFWFCHECILQYMKTFNHTPNAATTDGSRPA